MNSFYWKALPLKIVLIIALYPVVGGWAFLLAPLAIISLIMITHHSDGESSKPKGGLNAHGVWKKNCIPGGPGWFDVDPDEDEQGRPYDRNGRIVKPHRESRADRELERANKPARKYGLWNRKPLLPEHWFDN
jgi:hypothetical protein